MKLEMRELSHFISSASTAQVDIKHCRFEKISLHKATDVNPLDTSIIPTQCCVVIIKVPEHSLFSTHSYSFINSVFANILAGKTEDPDFMMTTTLDYAPVMLTYNEYPAIQTSQRSCNITFRKSRFISTHGSHSGAIDIRGQIGSVILESVKFSKTVAEDGVRFTHDAVYGNCMYASGVGDIQHFASEFIKLCRSDSNTPKLAAQSSLDFGLIDFLIPDFQSTLIVARSGSDSIGLGTDSSPYQTVSKATSICNPKKASLVEKVVDQEQYPVTVIIKDGTFTESQMRIISERITIQDNTECKLDINGIAFEQQNFGSLDDDAFIMIQYGEVRLQSCSFRQTDSSTQHNTSFIKIKYKQPVLQGILFSNGNFSSETSAIEVSSGSAVVLFSNFTSITGYSALSADLQKTFDDLIFRDCKFSQLSCSSQQAVVVSSSFNTDFNSNQVRSILRSPSCTFTRCNFTDNSANGGVKFLGYLILICFSQCFFDSTNTIYYNNSQTTSSNSQIIGYPYNGLTQNQVNETITVSSTGTSIHSIIEAINGKTQGGQSLLTLLIGSGTWEDDGLMIGARSISMEGQDVNQTTLMNKVTNRIWLACIIGGRLNIRNIGLQQASSSEYYGGMLVLRGDGIIDLSNVVIRQREQTQNQTSNTIYASAGNIIITDCIFEKASYRNEFLQTIYSASIYCEDKFGSLTITHSTFSQQITSFIVPPTVDELRHLSNVEYGGGAIVIQNAQVIKLVECNFTQNQGWLTGAINIQNITKSWASSESSSSPQLSFVNCNFDNNVAVKDRSIQIISFKYFIG
ncbi:MAG: hypothetical protein EZS28_025052, partial [Streblomastix strix]